ncbi:MAG: hypothetical protein J6K20_04435 [Thermoguttaceae bacterium]|nr:hypothetical protein [Thermoguttaceae bacterium]
MSDAFRPRRPSTPFFFAARNLPFALILTFATFLTATRADDAPQAQASASPARRVLVVSPPIFDAALQPWIERRQAEGYQISRLSLAARSGDSVDFGIQTAPVATPDELRAQIRRFALSPPGPESVAAVVLVGDGAPTLSASFGWRDVVPAPRLSPQVVQIFGSEDHLATDSFYSDLDDDGVPDVPLGRFPVETPAELTALVEKIARYETASPPGDWTRKINVVAGPNGLDLSVVGSSPDAAPAAPSVALSGLSSFVDSVVDNMSRQLFSEFLPQEYAVSLTRCSLKSEFCPYPPTFGRTFLDRANEGSLFLVYLGHGRVFGLDRLTTASGGDYGVFEIDDVPALRSPNGAPIALFFSCYAGAYDANEPCLAEAVALSPNGPVAAIAASRRTAPYGMCVLGSSLLDAAFDNTNLNNDKKLTLGEIFLRAQRKTLEPPQNDATQQERENEIQFDDETSPKDAAKSQPVLPSTFNETTADPIERAERRIAEERGRVAEINAGLDRLNARLEQTARAAERRRDAKSFRETLDRAAKIFDPTASRLEKQLEDHVALFNLFGDPLLRVKFPERCAVEAPEIAYSTKTLPVSGVVPNATERQTTVRVELLLADFRSPIAKPRRSKTFVESAEARAEFETTYRAANNFVVAASQVATQTERFQADIVVPADFSGECVVRVAATDGDRYWIGSRRVLVRPFSVRDAEVPDATR